MKVLKRQLSKCVHAKRFVNNPGKWNGIVRTVYRVYFSHYHLRPSVTSLLTERNAMFIKLYGMSWDWKGPEELSCLNYFQHKPFPRRTLVSFASLCPTKIKTGPSHRLPMHKRNMVSCEVIFNKKVLLRERKRHTARKRAQDADPPPTSWTWPLPPPTGWTWPPQSADWPDPPLPAGPDPPPLADWPDPPPHWLDLIPPPRLTNLTPPRQLTELTPPCWLDLTPPPISWLTWPPPPLWTN